MIRALIASGALAALAGSASAGILSFAANDNFDGPEFRASSATTIADGRTLDLSGAVLVNLTYDPDGDGALPPLPVIHSELRVIALTRDYSLTPFAGQFIHSWRMDGTAQFLNPVDSTLVLAITFANALFTSQSATPGFLGTSATLQGNIASDPALTFTTGPTSPLNAGDFSAQQDFAFSLSDLRKISGTGRPAVSSSGEFPDLWRAESSFVASGVPTPGAFALLTIGGLVASRRRR